MGARAASRSPTMRCSSASASASFSFSATVFSLSSVASSLACSATRIHCSTFGGLGYAQASLWTAQHADCRSECWKHIQAAVYDLRCLERLMHVHLHNEGQEGGEKSNEHGWGSREQILTFIFAPIALLLALSSFLTLSYANRAARCASL